MRNGRTGFYKGLPGLRRQSAEAVFSAAEHSIYEWWWQFLRLSPVLWYAHRTGLTPADDRMAAVCAQAGNLFGEYFDTWWYTTGSELFEEARMPLKLRRVDELGLADHVFYPEGKSMLVEVPLTVTSRTLVADFKKLLAQVHGRQRVDVLAHSSARWRLHTKRFNALALENQFWVLVYRLLYPQIAAWRIGDRLQIAPGLQVRGIAPTSALVRKSTPHARMQSTVGRFLYKAQRTVYNAELGSFPNSQPVRTVAMPFGRKHHAEYVAAVEGIDGERSEWQRWLRSKFHSALVARIKVKNRITGMNAVDPKVVTRLPKFIAGESDIFG